MKTKFELDDHYPKSMTGFSRIEKTFSWGYVSIEIRSVNHRYLELGFRLPENFRSLELNFRELQKKYLQRGKVDSFLSIKFEEKQVGMQLDNNALEQLQRATKQVKKFFPKAKTSGVIDILHWPGVIKESETDKEKITEELIQLYEISLVELNEHRFREGQQLAKIVQTKIASIEDQLQQAIELAPSIIVEQRQKLDEKLKNFSVNGDPDRLEQEMVILANKIDIQEELDRLQAHLNEVKSTLKRKIPIGRRLDFLMQELNREANTLASKSINQKMTQIAVELKVLIEQIREQIQNIE